MPVEPLRDPLRTEDRAVYLGTLYNHIPDLEELRTSRVPRQLESGK